MHLVNVSSQDGKGVLLLNILAKYSEGEYVFDHSVLTIPHSYDCAFCVPFEVLVRRQISRLLDPSLQCAKFIYDELIKVKIDGIDPDKLQASEKSLKSRGIFSRSVANGVISDHLQVQMELFT
ncbi:hypothetical protein BHE74_00013528 [Ensete ventricosum]|nr:hypothetical protein BHE74_00013528 [Ensete ventricosum]